MPDLLSIRERHLGLRVAFAGSNPNLATEDYRRGIDGLLSEIEQSAKEATSMEDYLWLCDALDYWRTAGPVLGIEVERVLAPPSVAQLSKRVAASPSVWSEDNFEEWLGSKASAISKTRALEWHAKRTVEEIQHQYRRTHPGEQEENWGNAEVYLAAEVLDGKLDLVRSLTPKSYWRLEGAQGQRWIREVKELKAYLRWKERGGGWGSGPKDSDYLEACSELRDAVSNSTRKAPQLAFEPFQVYIDKEFLDAAGALDAGKDRVKTAITAKAEVSGVDWTINRAVATKYMQDFYQNMRKAVLGGEASATRRVIEALGLCNGFEQNQAMVNCFEMAVAIYFLDPKLAQEAMG